MSKKAILSSALVLILLAGIAVLLWPVYLSPEARYARIVSQLRRQIIAAELPQQSRESSPREEKGRVEVIRALQTAIANAQCHLPDVARDKVRRIAEDVRTSRGEILHTRRGMYQLWAQLEQACPSLRDYPWMVSLREMQQAGLIPKDDAMPNHVPTPPPPAGSASTSGK